MPRSLTAVSRAAALAQNTDAAFWQLLEITHPSLPIPLRFCNNNETLTRLGFDWMPAFFDVDLPGEDGDKIASSTLTIEAIDRVLLDALLALDSPLSVAMYVCTSADETMLIGPFDYVWRNTEYDAKTIRAQLEFEDLLNRKCVKDEYVPSKFPGGFR